MPGLYSVSTDAAENPEAINQATSSEVLLNNLFDL